MTLVPVGDNVVLRRTQKQTMVNGIYLPDSAQKRPNEGKVLAVGDGKLLPNGTRKPMQVRDGDRVLFETYRATEVEVDGKDYLIVPEEGIIAVIE
ncbi:MAG: co-chaperone GroES [Thermoguttaceae bacterium]|nr:co-chaperone GroES [Thermoguttaceae bacterium]